MDLFKQLLRRDEVPEEDELNPTMVGLLIALLSLVLLGLSCIGALLILRRVRQRREVAAGILPTHNKSPSMTHLHASPSTGSRRGHRRTLTITSTPYAAPIVSYHDQEKAEFLNEKGGPASPVPEIHITFPEEHGEKRGSRVVVVKITDNGNVGLEPYEDKDQLPKYEREERKSESRDEWRSLDLERMGGLKEKDEKRWG